MRDGPAPAQQGLGGPDGDHEPGRSDFAAPRWALPEKCTGAWLAPPDGVLGLVDNQRQSTELMRAATRVAVFVPLTTATDIVARLSHVRLGASTVCHWVQTVGERAQPRLEAELTQLAADGTAKPEALSATIAQLLMIVGADGVMVPFRPTPGSAKGATVWREIKVGVMARLARHSRRHGQSVTSLCQRRRVAVRGDIDTLAARLTLEALRQGVASAPRVIWVGFP